jgi:hypothetical protein
LRGNRLQALCGLPRVLSALTGFVELAHQFGAAFAGHPHADELDACIKISAAPMLLEEGVEGGE